ncbi:hypothetical protein Poli38472_006501 [Pythium oligandrum]|uniref:protein-serine/threonine phosphatase n=1 Tax=Pythium oligandrum TaxID=41045 RepID=A0A8K1FBV0_PYTOL|nr:hypothetical protein Poli38472_006501 [Pythium oligandrum]|eukprot:TMW56491.1 hypothetical protein Poli38472_006501 [Pythium oligandrum]
MGCIHSRDAIEAALRSSQENPEALRASLNQMLKVPSAKPSAGSSHRDVFSIFADHGLMLEQEEVAAASYVLSPCSASGSVFSTATTASDTERSHMTHGPLDQYVASLDVTYGSYSDKGMRKANEDRKVCVSEVVRGEPVAYFGVYDGHNGANVADHLTQNLHISVFDRLKESNDMRSAIENAFSETDDYIFKKQMDSGSTALSMMVRGRDLIIASVGDSQAVLSTGGKARPMSVLHTPDHPFEKERILSAKGVVVNGRIFGLLGVSRSFGDNDFKTSRGDFKARFEGDLVIATPDIVEHTISDNDDFMVLACDGLYEVMQPQQVVDFVRAKLALHGGVQHACEELVSYAISIGSTDNVSAVVVCFNQVVKEEPVKSTAC